MIQRVEKVWLFASGKGGTGKSTLAVNLAASLALDGKRVLLQDLNLGLRCLDLLLGVEDRVLFDLMDVLEGVCRPVDAVIKCPSIPGLELLPAAQNKMPEELDGKNLQALCEWSRTEYDFVFLDCLPGISPVALKAAAIVDFGMMVTTADAVSLRDTDRLITELAFQGLNRMGLALNRFRPDYVKQRLSPAEPEMAEMLGLPLQFTLPESEDLLLSSFLQLPVVVHRANSEAARLFRKWANEIAGKGTNSV